MRSSCWDVNDNSLLLHCLVSLASLVSMISWRLFLELLCKNLPVRILLGDIVKWRQNGLEMKFCDSEFCGLSSATQVMISGKKYLYVQYVQYFHFLVH